MMKLFLYAEENADPAYAKSIADKLSIPISDTEPAPSKARKKGRGLDQTDAEARDPLYLRLSESGLSLNQGDLVLKGDFTTMLPRLRQANLNSEMLVKAAKPKSFSSTPCGIDATAGMGEDALLLAAAGFDMRLYEFDPVIAALLSDTLKRASRIPELAHIVARMELICGDSIVALSDIARAKDNGDSSAIPDIVLLDPMFPERQKSGLIKKKFQLLQQLESPCSTEEELLKAAMSAGPRRIIIKRPQKGPFLAGIRPDYSLNGKAIRYDVLTFAIGG